MDGPEWSRDPYPPHIGKIITATMKNGQSFQGTLDLVTTNYIRLQSHGETCVLRRDDVSVFRTARVDSPQARSMLTHGTTEVGKVPS